MSDGGKGSARRPTIVSDSTFDERWDAIFMREEEDADMETDVQDSGAGNDSEELESIPST